MAILIKRIRQKYSVRNFCLLVFVHCLTGVVDCYGSGIHEDEKSEKTCLPNPSHLDKIETKEFKKKSSSARSRLSFTPDEKKTKSVSTSASTPGSPIFRSTYRKPRPHSGSYDPVSFGSSSIEENWFSVPSKEDKDFEPTEELKDSKKEAYEKTNTLASQLERQKEKKQALKKENEDLKERLKLLLASKSELQEEQRRQKASEEPEQGADNETMLKLSEVKKENELLQATVETLRQTIGDRVLYEIKIGGIENFLRVPLLLSKTEVEALEELIDNALGIPGDCKCIPVRGGP